MVTGKMSYDSAGVDLEAADAAVALMKGHMRGTYGPRVLGKHGGFAGCFRLDYNEKLFQRNYRDPVLISCADGVGTKVLVAAKLGVYDTVGQDVVAMSINDMIVYGAEPLFFLDYIGLHRVDPPQVAQIVKGVADGCKLAGCALLGGETAEMAEIYKVDDFDLAGFAVGVCELKRLVQGTRAVEGDVILGLASSGVHSNGFTLIRAIVKRSKLRLGKVYGGVDPTRTLGEVLLTPTRIYAKAITSVLRKYQVKQPVRAMSHITGGGLPGNVMRSLGAHLNARIERKRWRIPPLFDFLQRHGCVEDEQMLRVFNLGIGFVCVVRPHFADSIAHQLTRAGEEVVVLGKVVRGTGRLVLA